ncbi:hypothetical protein [Kineococcus glutinatus]|uniref:Uncharacterized protein n=1 Tax=Kineococcus glutinatus TaxID=1070872 RepID=A0ABP8VKR9_9ACTN
MDSTIAVNGSLVDAAYVAGLRLRSVSPTLALTWGEVRPQTGGAAAHVVRTSPKTLSGTRHRSSAA